MIVTVNSSRDAGVCNCFPLSARCTMRLMNGRMVTIGLAIFAALPLLYIGAYLALMDGESLRSISFATVSHDRYTHYRFGGDFAEWVFAPANHLDRFLRPKYWHESHQLP
jgi:hypothetical protein